jgi:competence protein ComEC
MREPLLLPVFALTAGIVLARLAVFSVREAWTMVTVFAVLGMFALWLKSSRMARTCGLLAFASVGVLTGVIHAPGQPPEMDAQAGEVLVVGGCVVEPPVFFENREQFVLEIDPGARARVSLSLREGEQAPPLRYGQKVELDARIRKPRNFHNPGSFDYTTYLGRQWIYWTASAPAGTEVKVLPGACGSRFWAFIFAIRVAALDRIDRLYPGDSYSAEMMKAILLGESSKLEKIWTEHFRRTGTYHALVISGMHVTVLAGVLLFLLRVCFIPELSALTIAMIAAWIYALVSGWSAPVVRAAGGFTLYLIARFFYRRGRILNMLSAVALGFLLFDPAQLFDASFQLSFLSVAAIGALAVPLLEMTTKEYANHAANLLDPDLDLHLSPRVAAMRVEARLLAEAVSLTLRLPVTWADAAFSILMRGFFFAFELMSVSAIIQISLALPMAMYFHRISITGLTANLLIVPMMSAAVPIGFAAIFTGWGWIAWMGNLLLKWSENVAAWHTQFEPQWRVPDPPLWLAIACTLSTILLAVTLRKGRYTRWPALAASLTLFGVLIAHPFAPLLAPGQMELTMIDVGQGDSLFIASPRGKTMIVDGGGIPSFGKKQRTRLDIGEDVVSPYLWTRSIRRVDVIVLSHAHADHIDGLPALIENFHPAELWIGANSDNPIWKPVRDKARQTGAIIRERRSGERFDWGGAGVEILAPFPDYEAGLTPKNNDSLVFRITYGEQSFLLTGDMEKQIEYGLLNAGLLKHSDVLKVAHHGSKTSSTEQFLELVHPVFGLISVGAENFYRHPAPEIVSRLNEHHVRVIRTDLTGITSIRTDGHRLTLETSQAGSSLLPVF